LLVGNLRGRESLSRRKTFRENFNAMYFGAGLTDIKIKPNGGVS